MTHFTSYFVKHVVAGFAALAAVQPASAETRTSYTTYGTPGLIDMPTAHSAADAELATTLSYFGGSTRTTLTFQITPRLSGSFRYSSINNWVPTTGKATFDRSFDLRYRFLDEGTYRPAMAIGLQDIIGTGIYSGEYVVASKTIQDRFIVSGGIGWGRYGSYNGFDNPLGRIDDRFNVRPTGTTGTGGQVEANKWFRGDAALFGGVSWQATDRLTLKAEYSSDNYSAETRRNLFNRNTPYNFGVDYKLREGINAQVYYMHGDELGFAVNILTNPRFPAVNGGRGVAPLPVKPRGQRSAADLGWTHDTGRAASIASQTQNLLRQDGMELEAYDFSGREATVHIRNTRYLARAEAIGRTARILTHTAPASVDVFHIVPVVDGLPASKITLRRQDLEELEFAPDGSWQSFARAQITDAANEYRNQTRAPGVYPRFRWSLGPYAKTSLFDPDNPVRADLGLRLQARYDFSPGLFAKGAFDYRVVGNRSESKRVSSSVLPHVRSDANIYAREGEAALTDLTLTYQFRPGRDLYGRVTVGYLEQMCGGISTELLWKPVDSRLALGAEINYVKQRDFDQQFGFQNYEIFTGHASAYYDFGNGYEAQFDAGRYLAGDWGATLKLQRTFANGWEIGAYATLTDVSFNDFGEGSFDKGITLTIPLDHFAGRPTGRKHQALLQPLLRDGGARLNVDGRLYEQVRSYHQPDMKKTWGRFFR